MSSIEQVLLFGGSGYIGTHLMLELHGNKSIGEEGKTLQVVILDNRPPNQEAVKYAQEKAELDVLFFNQDLEDKNLDAWPSSLTTAYCGIMLAAKKDVTEAEDKKYDYIRSNILICVNCMEYLAKLGVKKLIQASSSTIYHTDNDNSTRIPIGTYGYSKRVCEDICYRLLKSGQQLAILRYMNPIGTHPDVKVFPDIGLCNVLSKMSSDKIFCNRGNCSRDYIHITDLASYHTALLERWDDIFSDFKGVVVNLDVGTGISTTTDQIYEMFFKITGRPRAKNKIPYPRNDFEAENIYSMTIINPRGWKPKISLAKALEDYKI